MTSTASYYGFIYTIFGLGASHMGFIAGAWGKSQPDPAHGLEPNDCDHCFNLIRSNSS
jgi:hypothetical protein